MNGKRKVLLFSILGIIVISLAGIGVYYWFNNTYYVSTEDARVTGDLVKVSPQISGKLLEFDVEEGDRVIEDQILGRQEMVNLADTSIDLSLLRAPSNGIVTKKQGNIGEMASPGQTLAVIIDPDQLYISANIEETKLNKVKPGQIVDISIDQYPGIKFSGKVDFIGLAANSTFSLLPSSTGGTFTKTVQRIPVSIEIDKNKYQLLPGTNAIVKIHIK
ncbi:multidrug resistance efflux pump [Anaerosolibacter carboniphilus]|uniref:Multidrug resistance efflux pump n=1 Tax=Anaerosolibacter carboniphilus TaxID=1417629 RepID=A0A841KPZ7_9FIRM|nr:efflux RND transporter periplasmic adaptor subunit [Anaerosolibacter carboniphilus]MBB6214170.1 multidrug resistance efflux pump [Anaerosolibacter carboniphilus]